MKRTGLWRKWCVRALAFGVAAAGIFPGNVILAEEGGAAMGRYLESEVALPENLEVMDVVRTSEGTLRIVGQGDDGYTIWDSADGGAGWEQTGALPEAYAKGEFFDIDLNPEGGGAAIGLDVEEDSGGEAADAEAAGSSGGEAADAEAPEYQEYLILFDSQGNVTVRKDCDDSYLLLCYAQDGQMTGMTAGGRVTKFDPDTGEVTGTIAEGADMIGTCGQEMLAFAADGLQRYDLASGEPLARDDALDKALYANQSHPYEITSTASVPIVVAEDEEGRLYYGTNDGIFAHTMEGSVVERVVDGSLGILASPSTALSAMAVLDQCFYLVCLDREWKLIKFEYSENTPSVPQKELTVYSLLEKNELRESITLFQKQHPDTYVNYEVGISGGDGVTASDALRTLNTEILAGDGPDILLLDGLPADTYAEQGLLTDLSGIAAEIRDSEGLMDNVVGAYEQDGAVYTIPQRFGIVMVAGVPEQISGIDSLDAIEALAGQQGMLEAYDIAFLPNLLYRVCAGSWKNEDGTLDQEKVAQYVHAVRQITDTWKENNLQGQEALARYQEGEDAIGWNGLEEVGLNGDDLTLSILTLYTRECGVAPGALYRIMDYSGLMSANRETGACAVALPKLFGENFFVPCGMLGVLSTSKQPEQAAEFVKFLLLAETQEQIDSDGFPVNRTALELLMSEDRVPDGFGVTSSNKDGNYVSLEFAWPTEAELAALMAMARQVNAPVETERIQRDVVIEEMQRCLDGETGEDEAVNAIMQRLNLYLAE